MNACIAVCMSVCVYLCICVCMCVYVCMYVCMCMCVSDLNNNRFACNSNVYVCLGLSYPQPNILHQRAMDDPLFGGSHFWGIQNFVFGSSPGPRGS